MTAMRDDTLCALFRESLADPFDDVQRPDLAEHLADCDDCRDVRHDARVTARALREAGADYVPLEESVLLGRLMTTLDAREATPATASPFAPALAPTLASPAIPTVPTAPVSVQDPAALPPPPPTVTTPSHGTPTLVAPFPASPTQVVMAPVQVPATATQVSETQVVSPPTYVSATQAVAPQGPVAATQAVAPPGAAVIPLRRRPMPSWGLGAVFGAVAAAAAALVIGFRAPSGGKDDGAVPVTRVAQTWRATVTRVVRPTEATVGGLDAQAPGTEAWESANEGATLLPGTRIRTNARTRARLDLDDGTVLVLDRDAEVFLDPSGPRRARLVRGHLVADVAHREGSTARIETPNGTVEVLGTKFALTATEGRTLVRVTRGRVRLTGDQGSTEVTPGQEGVVAQGSVPVVSPAVDLAGSVAWSEIGPQGSGRRDEPVVGFGELRARRPGNTQEREEIVRLTTHTVKVRVVGNVARTEIEEVFHNASGREMEGIYRFPLPPEAQVEDLALDVEGRMESGAFVDRDRASAIWRGVIRNATAPAQRVREEYVWVPGPWRDPALLEWQRGGRFELRVFPIPANGSRRVRIVYTQTIPASGGARRYVLPLPHDPAGSTRVEQFEVDLQVLGHDVARGVSVRGYPLRAVTEGVPVGGSRMQFSQAGFVPSGDLVVEYALPDANRAATSWAFAPAEGPALATLALRPTLPRWNESRPRDYVLVVDASRSMVGERWARAGRLASALVAEMDRRDRFTVLACDTRCTVLPGGMAYADADAARGALSFLQGVEPAGASDLVGMVESAVGAATGADRALRVVYVGDGVATAGFRRPATLLAAVRGVLARRPGATLTAVGVGGGDSTTLETLARAGGGVVVPYVPGERLDAAALAVLEATYGVVLRDPVVELPPGMTEMAPSQPSNLRAGAEMLLSVQLPTGRAEGDLVLRGTVDGQPFESRYPVRVEATRDAGNAFVPRLYAAARVIDLEARSGPEARAEAVTWSQRWRVPSRYTSLLVLESEAMFRAFGVDRGRAPGDTWTGETAAAGQAVAGGAESERAEEGNDTTAALGDSAAEPDEMASVGQGGLMGSVAHNAGAGMGSGVGRSTRENDAAPLAAQAAQASGERRRAALSRGPMARPSSASDDMMEAPSATAPPPPAAPMAPANEQAATLDSVLRTRPGAGGRVVSTPMQQPPPPPRWPGGRGGQWMRRTWVRRAAITPRVGTAEFAGRVATARQALAESPDSRDRHKELFRWLSLQGELDQAGEIATRWMVRDPLDPEALQAAADVAARRGERDVAVRLLGGVVDVRPDDLGLHERLAVLHTRGGNDRAACAHRIAAAEIRGDVARLSAALACARALGHTEAAAVMRDAVPDVTLRAQLATLAAPPGEPSARGELMLRAVWDGGEDLDLVLVDPQGRRVSWQGGRAGVTVTGPRDLGREELGLSRASTGTWLVEVVRAGSAAGGARRTGSVTVSILGQRAVVPFVMEGASARVAQVRVTSEMVLVPMQGPVPALAR